MDTNVYISALLHTDRAIFAIIQEAQQERYRLLLSPAIVNEIGKVLHQRFGLPTHQVTSRLKTLVALAEIVMPSVNIHVIVDDPPDNRILECAIEGQANLIVSGDSHLLRLKTYRGIPIVRPTDFLRTLGVPTKS